MVRGISQIKARMTVLAMTFVTALCTTLPAPSLAHELPSCRDQWTRLTAAGQGYQYQAGYRVPETYSAYYARVRRQDCLKDWTVLVYMEAGHDLAPYALWDLDEMESGFSAPTPLAASTLTTDLVTEVRVEDTPGIRRLHMFEDDRVRTPRTLADFQRRTVADVRSPVIEQKFSNDRSLADFVLWGMRRYPARHTAVIIWGHGRGWKPVRSKIDDWTHAHAFDSSEVARSLDRVARATGRPVDLFAADSCLMQSADAVAALQGLARFAVGSDQIQNLLGFPYRRVLYELNHGALEKAPDPAAALAWILPRLMLQSYDPRSGSQGRFSRDGAATVLLSAVDVQRFARVTQPALDALALDLAAALRAARPEGRRNLDFLIGSTFALGQSTQDLAVTLGLLRRWAAADAPALLPRIDAASEALRRSLVSFARGPGYATDPNTSVAGELPVGVSVWLPQNRDEFSGGLVRYQDSPFINRPQTPWRQWLEALYRS